MKRLTIFVALVIAIGSIAMASKPSTDPYTKCKDAIWTPQHELCGQHWGDSAAWNKCSTEAMNACSCEHKGTPWPIGGHTCSE